MVANVKGPIVAFSLNIAFAIGLIVIVPMLGHASWHAYRDLVDTRGVPERMPGQKAV